MRRPCGQGDAHCGWRSLFRSALRLSRSEETQAALRHVVCVLCTVGRRLGRDARWFAARDCSFACSNREFEGFCAFAAAPLLVQIVCDGLEEWQHDNVPTGKSSLLRRARRRIRTTKRTMASSQRPSEDRFSVTRLAYAQSP